MRMRHSVIFRVLFCPVIELGVYILKEDSTADCPLADSGIR